MHRCIAIPTWAGDTRIVSRPSIAIRITIRIKYRDQCIAIRDTHHVMSTLRDDACVAIRVSIPPPAATRHAFYDAALFATRE